MTKPLSEKLDTFILKWFNRHSHLFEFTDEDTFEEGEAWYKQWRYQFQTTGKMKIWTGKSQNSIYGSSIVNIYARAWHDWCHYTNALDFTLSNELLVAEFQIASLPESWEYERLLIEADTKGQSLHYEEWGQFPKNQRDFVLNYVSIHEEKQDLPF
jgi:hypothetical protein